MSHWFWTTCIEPLATIDRLIGKSIIDDCFTFYLKTRRWVSFASNVVFLEHHFMFELYKKHEAKVQNAEAESPGA